MNAWLSVLVDVGLMVILGLLAVLPGSAVVTSVFRRVDRADAPGVPETADDLDRAGEDESQEPRGEGGGRGTARSDEGSEEQPPATLQDAGEVLRGGRWIGMLERTAVFASIVAGYPNGVAVTVAVKALARYPELKSTSSAAAERFIIGSFVSVLWASGWAGLARWAMLLL